MTSLEKHPEYMLTLQQVPEEKPASSAVVEKEVGKDLIIVTEKGNLSDTYKANVPVQTKHKM